jgi:bifunctional enzyme CysN/CysC
VEGRRNLWDEGPAVEVRRRASRVTLAEREERNRHKAVTILLTGLTASGKALIAYELERRLFDAGRQATVLEGAALRLGISKDLGFTYDDRSENLRRAAEVARLIMDSGQICILSMVAPDADVRARVRELLGAERFIEVYVSAPVEVCRQRDDKGIYQRADAGELQQFPGVSAPYQVPTSPDLVLPSHEISIDECVDRLLQYLDKRRVLR